LIRRANYVVADHTGTRPVGACVERQGMHARDARGEPEVDHNAAIAMLRAIAQGFDRHDLAAIMTHFDDDAVFESPRGSNAWGQRFVGKEAVRRAFAGRFAGIPDVRYQQDDHFADGDRGASEWTLSGTTVEGQRLEVRGCDLWTFRDGKVVKKDSFWKILTTE
jgi:ketosteroid isomerase-like protein